MSPDQVSAELCPMGFEHFGDGDTWYLRRSGRKWPKTPPQGWAGFVHAKKHGGWVAMHRRSEKADQRVEFSDPIAAATWLLMEVSNG